LTKDTEAHAASVVKKATDRLRQRGLLEGMDRHYAPKVEGGDQLPSETQRVQVRAGEVIMDVKAALIAMFNLTASKDWANTTAKADVVIDGSILVAQAPVTFLMFLEKRLVELDAWVNTLPENDPSESWVWDAQNSQYRTGELKTVRNEKTKEVIVLYEATKEHPAQTQLFDTQKPVGTWTMVKSSGALPPSEVAAIRHRIMKLSAAVKTAREEANTIRTEEVQVGTDVLNWIFPATPR
jgi:hypothetical protein